MRQLLVFLVLFFSVSISDSALADPPNKVICRGEKDDVALQVTATFLGDRAIVEATQGTGQVILNVEATVREVSRRIFGKLVHFVIFDQENGGFFRIRTIDKESGAGLWVKDQEAKNESQTVRLMNCQLFY